MNEQLIEQRWVLKLAYDGSRYSGWQTQRNGMAIQDVVQQAIAIPLKQPVTLIGASRTDSGVHAQCQIAHFDSPEIVAPQKVLYSLNGLLPADIRCLGIAKAPDTFHAQLNALQKRYRYRIQLGRVADPLRRHYCWHIAQTIDRDLLWQALKLFEGYHDFSAFANQGGSALGKRGAWRTIFEMSLESINDELIIECCGDGFLYKMVRNMVGAAVAVSQNKLSLEQLKALFNHGDRRSLPAPAVAHGLCLIQVMYPEEPEWQC